MIDKLDQIARDKHTSVAAVALAWLRAQVTVAAPIASATNLGQVKELMPIIKLELEELEILNLA